MVREMERVDFREAMEILARKYGLEVPKFKAGPSQDEQEVRWRQTLQEVLTHAATFYQERLAHPQHGAVAREYLERRGIASETISAFGLGVASDDWDVLSRHLMYKGYTQKALVEAGLAKDRGQGEGVYDLFRGRLMFPIYSARGNVISFGGRIFEGDGPKYINGPETVLYSKGRELYGLHIAKDAMTRGKMPAVLVEGYMDVIASHQAGVTSAIASLGTALTPDQARLIRRHQENAVFLYDADEAGLKAILRGLESLVAAGLNVRVGVMPAGEDPDSVARKFGAEALQAVVRDAVPFFDFLVRHVRARYDFSSPEARVQALELFQPVLSAISEPLVYEGYVTKLAAEMGHEEGALHQYLAKHRQKQNRRIINPQREAPVVVESAPMPTPPPGYDDGYYETPPEEHPPVDELVAIASPMPREMGILHILMEHGDARVLARGKLSPEWIQHPLVRYWVGVLLAPGPEVADVWPTLMSQCPSPAHQEFLTNAVFATREELDENYIEILEHLVALEEADYRKAENRRLNMQISEAARNQNPEELQELVAQQMRNMKRRLAERQRATQHITSIQTKR
ncbi:TPA: DNA primase [Candidatus Sumerlaeota bacterium]|nr:DNA primase [Candidatus Sumerlaeota bacterium]